MSTIVAICTCLSLTMEGNFKNDSNKDGERSYSLLFLSSIYSLYGTFVSFYLYGRKVNMENHDF